jgi:hypothetical protein
MQWWRQLYYSFPVQLLVLHLRSNHLLLITWLVFALLMSGRLASKFGIQYLLLDPEYLGAVNFWSFFIQGVAFGSFFMSWNLTLYLLSAQYFPFLASLSKPFTKFIINNLVLPLSFFIVYLSLIVYFQHYYEGLGFSRILYHCLGLILGCLCLISLYSLYFYFTNRDISYYKPMLEELFSGKPTTQIKPGHRKVDLEYIKLDANRWEVHNYLSETLQPRLVRSVAHYDSKMLMSIFRQNHLNALILQLLSMVVLLLLGYQIDSAVFRIPAGASMFLLASVFIAIVGAVTYWFNEWSVTIIVGFLLAVNFLTRCDVLAHTNRAYGMDFETESAIYDVDSLQAVIENGQVEKDKANTQHILENWKVKNSTSPEEKPKMVVLCASGGGLKSATWTMQVVRRADSLLNGELLPHTVLITGASGGMLGMGYLRELYLRKQKGADINLYDKQYIDNITKDLVNSIAFTIVSNDLFLPWTTFEVGEHSYQKDRGYIFEQQLNENTGYILDKSIADYRAAEQEATIPMLYFTPSIINDARRLVISPQGATFMMVAPVGVRIPQGAEVDAVDFQWLFKNQGADDLRMLTAMRMNASYPYVLPTVHLPSIPAIELIDAGFLDNYGILAATRFIQVYQDWIKENTSGVVLLQISCSQRIEEIGKGGGKGAIESLFNPLGIIGKVMEKQEYEQDNSLGFIYDILGDDHFSVIRFIYRPTSEGQLEAAISFHITEREKEDILRAIDLPANIAGLRQLQQLMGQ